jgi:hypothetical protein
MGNEGGPIVYNIGQQGPQLTFEVSSVVGKWGNEGGARIESLWRLQCIPSFWFSLMLFYNFMSPTTGYVETY